MRHPAAGVQMQLVIPTAGEIPILQGLALAKVLHDAEIKFTSVASTIPGKTGRAILAALLAGEEDPTVLAELGKVGCARRFRPCGRNAGEPSPRTGAGWPSSTGSWPRP